MEGIDQIKIVLLALAEGINCGYKAFTGGGVFSLFGLMDEIAALKTLNKELLLAQLKDVSAEERATLLADFKAKLSIESAVLVEEKIEKGADALDATVAVALEAYEDYLKVRSVFEKWKAVFK